MSSSQNCSSVPHETRKRDTFDTSIKTLNDAREMITKDSYKETEVIPTQNSKGNLKEREMNAPNEEQPSKVVVAVLAKGGKTPLVTLSPQALNAILGYSSCHNICDKEESSESTSDHDCPWNRPNKGNKGNNARDLDMAIIDSESLIRAMLFILFSNANLTKNLVDGGNDVANSQAMTHRKQDHDMEDSTHSNYFTKASTEDL
ncbi:hypothetical protein ACH5RR_018500 [Cinchona calisaya]|uniref:Uncharacterized protein n=1 Tax=Cinchona calisaya TaxID=153742 RepID=A0ABD2ZLR3_9GENT